MRGERRPREGRIDLPSLQLRLDADGIGLNGLVVVIGLKGSDPSVYVLLYMLDFGAADVVACAAS